MTATLLLNLWEKGKNASLSLSRDSKRLFFLLLCLLVLLLPTQFGKHFWPDFSYLLGFRIDYLSPTLFLTDCITSVLLGVCFINTATRKPLLAFFRKHSVSLCLLLLLVTISTFSSLSLPLALYGAFKLVEFGLLAVCLSLFLTKDTLPSISFLFVIAGLFESGLAIWQSLIQHSVGSVFYFFGERQFSAQTPGIANADIAGQLVLRPYATLPHPNVLGAYLLVALIFAVSLLFVKQVFWKKWLTITFLLIGSVALLLSLGRANIILWTALLLIWIIKRLFKKGAKKMLLPAVCLAVAVLIFGGLFFDVAERFLTTRLTETAITTRLTLLEEGWSIFLRHPLFGVGLKNVLPSLARLSPKSYPWQLQPIHTIYLMWLVETGITGGVFCFWFLAKTVRKAVVLLKKQDTLWPAALSLVCLLFLGLFDHYPLTLQQGQLLLAFLIGLVWIRK